MVKVEELREWWNRRSQGASDDNSEGSIEAVDPLEDESPNTMRLGEWLTTSPLEGPPTLRLPTIPPERTKPAAAPSTKSPGTIFLAQVSRWFNADWSATRT